MTIERKAWYIAVKELVPFLPVNTQAAIFFWTSYSYNSCVRNNMKLRISEQFEATSEFPETYSLNSNASADIHGITTNWV